MPTAESEETMHLFIDFLAEEGICQAACERQRSRGGCVHACTRDRVPIYMTHWREARNVIQPQKDAERAWERGERRDNRHIQGNCFLSRSSSVCPSTPATCARMTYNVSCPQRHRLHAEKADKLKWLKWSLNTSRTAATITCVFLCIWCGTVYDRKNMSLAVYTAHNDPLDLLLKKQKGEISHIFKQDPLLIL